MVVSFAAGLGFANFGSRSYSTITIYRTGTFTTILRSSGSNASTAIITEVIFAEPELINDVCALETTLALHTSYFIGSTQIASSSAALTPATMTTTSVFLSGATTTLYNNATVISNGTTCTETNPHYNVTQTENSGCICV